MDNQDQSNLEKSMGLASASVAEIPSSANSPSASQLSVDQSLLDLYDKALEAYEEQINNAQLVEPRFAARNMEVAKMFLDSAFDAIALRQKQIEHVDKKEMAEQKLLGRNSPHLTQNNYILGDRNEILKKLVSPEDLPLQREDEFIDLDLSEVVKGEEEEDET